jgi:hypothetical protein
MPFTVSINTNKHQSGTIKFYTAQKLPNQFLAAFAAGEFSGNNKYKY